MDRVRRVMRANIQAQQRAMGENDWGQRIRVEFQGPRYIDVSEALSKTWLMITVAFKFILTKIQEHPQTSIKFGIIFIGWLIAGYFQLASIYFGIAVIYGIFTNLGTRKAGELSAYSVFNPGQYQLPGTFDAGQIDAMYRHGGPGGAAGMAAAGGGGGGGAGVRGPANGGGPAVGGADGRVAGGVVGEGASGSRKAKVNDPCPCGSGKKYKKCCLPRELTLHQHEVVQGRLLRDGGGEIDDLDANLIGLLPED